MMVFERCQTGALQYHQGIDSQISKSPSLCKKPMTIMEILIGLALVAGLFTWLTSAATIAFVGVFCLSGMFYWVNIWMIPMAFACMNGSGRAFGLDKWVVPLISRKSSVNGVTAHRDPCTVPTRLNNCLHKRLWVDLPRVFFKSGEAVVTIFSGHSCSPVLRVQAA